MCENCKRTFLRSTIICHTAHCSREWTSHVADFPRHANCRCHTCSLRSTPFLPRAMMTSLSFFDTMSYVISCGFMVRSLSFFFSCFDLQHVISNSPPYVSPETQLLVRTCMGFQQQQLHLLWLQVTSRIIGPSRKRAGSPYCRAERWPAHIGFKVIL